MPALDPIDRAIITLLHEDGRMSSAEIARRVGEMSPRTVHYHIKALQRRGLFSVRAVINPQALGYTVLADVIIETEPGLLQQIARQIASLPSVSYVACSTGDRDISIQILAQDNAELFRMVTEDIGTIPGVRRTQTHLLPVKIKDIDDWLPPEIMEATGS
jgi:Lrp/AsnC family transcriptional regulator for asnA, asnC and gidA